MMMMNEDDKNNEATMAAEEEKAETNGRLFHMSSDDFDYRNPN